MLLLLNAELYSRSLFQRGQSERRQQGSNNSHYTFVKTCTGLLLPSGNFSISFRAETKLPMAIKGTDPTSVSIIITELNNNNTSDNTHCVCCVWLCQHGHRSSALLNDFQLLLFVSIFACLFVSPNDHTGLGHCVSYIFLWFTPQGTHTLHTHCMPKTIREKKSVSGREEELWRRGEEVCLDIIKYLKTATTFGSEIIGCSTGKRGGGCFLTLVLSGCNQYPRHGAT